jgi:hypothetical protein
MASKPVRATLVAALLGTIASVLPPPLLAGAAGSPAEVADRLIEENVGLTSHPVTLEELRRMVEPRSERGSEVRNRHVPGQIDKVIALAGKGIEVDVYAPAAGPILVQRIRVTATDRKLPLGLRIGRTTLDDIYKAIGAGDAKGPAGEFARRYFNLESTANALLWVGRDERLAGVEWRFDGD